MKKNLFIGLCTAAYLLAGISSCSKDNEVESIIQNGQQGTVTKVIIRDSLVVETDSVGQLKEIIGDKSESLQKLIISGPIDATDVQTIRELSNLLVLNLKDATICGGDSTYKTGNQVQQLQDNIIGTRMFDNQLHLSEIILPNNLTGIANEAFYQQQGTAENPFTSINIPEGVTRIGQSAFYGCSNLTEVILPTTLNIIEEQTFQNCTKLQRINLETITAIRESAFDNCESLQNVQLPEGLTMLGYKCFAYSGLTSITVPASVTLFGNEGSGSKGYTFQNCNDLKSVTLPENMTEIPNRMFRECQSLTSVNIPSQVTHIREFAFSGCKALPEITLSEGLVEIESSAFSNCESLKDLTLPETLTTIGNDAFNGCSSITSISIPQATKSMGSSCFYNCISLVDITLPNNMSELPGSTFYGCSSLESIAFPTSIVRIGSSCFDQCTKLSQISFAKGLEVIEYDAFKNCTSLQTLTLPETLKEIERYAFAYTGLTEITLPEGVETLEEYAFSNCQNLTTASIPRSVTKAGPYLFQQCYKLTSIFWNTPATVPCLFSTQTQNINNNCLLYIADANTLVDDNYIANIIVNGIADEIVLSSTVGDFYVPQAFVTEKLTYTRDFTFPTYPGQAAGWRSICLPFTVENIIGADGQSLAPFNAEVEGAKHFWLRRLTPNGFENVTRIEANIPYIIAMPNSEAYDPEYNITGTVTFTAENPSGIAIPAGSDLTLTPDRGPEFTLNSNFSYQPASTTIYALNEKVIDDHYAGSIFIRNDRPIMPFEGYVSSNMLGTSTQSFFTINAGLPATRTEKPLGPVPSIDDM